MSRAPARSTPLRLSAAARAVLRRLAEGRYSVDYEHLAARLAGVVLGGLSKRPAPTAGPNPSPAAPVDEERA